MVGGEEGTCPHPILAPLSNKSNEKNKHMNKVGGGEMLEQHSRTSSTNTNAVELATLGRWQNKQTTVDDDQVSRGGVDDRTTSRRNEGERGGGLA